MRGLSVKYLITFFTLSACGVWVANAGISAKSFAVETENSSEEKISGKISANSGIAHSYRQPLTDGPAAGENDTSHTQRPIPAIILPNNICVINTDISPDRTIDEHIMACVAAHRLKQRTTR